MAEAVAPLTGNGSILAQRKHELAEYEKILKLRDEIFAGKHPRIKVPLHAIIKATKESSLENTHHSTSNAIGNGVSSPTRDHTPDILKLSQPTAQSSSFLGKSFTTLRRPVVAPSSSGSSTHHHFSDPPSSSGIDPIFLTKSETVVRAELQLQRQRLERILKESVDKPLEQDRISDFDVSEVLTKALQLVKPFNGPRLAGTNRMSAASDSFDENSYYSSQVNDSTDESNDVYDRAAEEGEYSTLASNNPNVELSQCRRSPRYSAHRIDDEVRNLAVADSNKTSAQSYNQQKYDSQRFTDHRGVREESEYSPPEANTYEGGHIDSSHGESSQGQSKGNMSPLNLKAGDLRSRASHAATRQTSLPSPKVRVVRNHIASPVAPQPSRVSPLAVAKLPPFARERRDIEEPLAIRIDEGQMNSARQSPEEVSQPAGFLKKRKNIDDVDQSRKYRKGNVADSPEPYIKEEPESPPPISAQPRRRRSKRLQQSLRPIELDDTFSQEYRSDSQYVREYQVPSDYDLRAPSSAAMPRASSRVDWSNQDLRRVASVQYARRAVSPPHYTAEFFPSEARSARAVSHTYSERPVMEHAQYYREPPRPYTGRYICSEKSQSPPLIRQSPAIMAPPPRRIVVDQHGNRYYAAPPIIDFTNSAPAPNRDENINPRYGPVPVRDYARRVPTAIANIYDEEGVVETMLPPPARRAVERADVESINHRAYRQRDYESRPVENLAPHDERVQLHQLRDGSYFSHVEPISLPTRDYNPRMHSVRPEVGHYEEPREYVPRVQSMRPELGFSTRGPARSEAPPRSTRELTTRPDDGPHVREYLHRDDDRFTHIPRPQSREYHDNAFVEWPRDEVQEVRGDETRRASYRY